MNVGAPENYRNLLDAVIHERPFGKLNEVIESALPDSPPKVCLWLGD